MLKELKEIVLRSSATLPEDVAGAVALVVMLYIGLNLPGLV